MLKRDLSSFCCGGYGGEVMVVNTSVQCKVDILFLQERSQTVLKLIVHIVTLIRNM